MKSKSMLLVVLMLVTVCVPLLAAQQPTPSKPPIATTALEPADTLVPTLKDSVASAMLIQHSAIVYYFHTTRRCVSCKKIEAYTREAIDSAFAGELKNGSLEWRMVNTDEAPNQHFLKDYKLFTKSVVLSELEDGKEVRWKNLDKVWTLIGKKEAFLKYIQDEVRLFLNEE